MGAGCGSSWIEKSENAGRSMFLLPWGQQDFLHACLVGVGRPQASAPVVSMTTSMGPVVASITSILNIVSDGGLL